MRKLTLLITLTLLFATAAFADIRLIEDYDYCVDWTDTETDVHFRTFKNESFTNLYEGFEETLGEHLAISVNNTWTEADRFILKTLDKNFYLTYVTDETDTTYITLNGVLYTGQDIIRITWKNN